ncbi:ROK family transcriptional regulator [Catenulispora sp. NF23]|uniref:ROK family transcriptional regulator n=1 Tax=Catenulispora pinistramenti TaxID=2705254 RepID=A0ABS5KQ58_9ACTN|nr:ROK family transcriptional regulator [Catenulispora pinistramenti]MBS2536875.1 ROK family transcriptional regulator [Catenulispora pinistramenti]MBS2548176.1 ROK family transcriptional regulator [Catenulispora pinistramenti]
MTDTRSERGRLAVVRLLRERGTLSRADIARATNLSRARVSGIVSELVADDVVVELGTSIPAAGGRAGRPGAAVMLNPTSGEAIGVDFGYRHVQVVIANVAHAVRIAKSARLPVGYAPAMGIDVAVDLVRTAISQAQTEPSRVLGIGVSVSGQFGLRPGEPDKNGSSTWPGTRIGEELAARLGLPVRVDGDSRLGALAERRWGAARGCDEFIYLRLHGGVGGAFVSNGLLAHGAAGGAGDIGHLVVDGNGPLCRCGNRGCLETYVGLSVVMRDLVSAHGDRLTLRNVVTMASQGEADCVRALAEAGRVAGQAVGILRTILDPEKVIIGGALASAGEFLMAPLRQAAASASARRASTPVTITTGALGPQACALGAVAMVLEETDEKLLAAMSA